MLIIAVSRCAVYNRHTNNLRLDTLEMSREEQDRWRIIAGCVVIIAVTVALIISVM